MKELLESDLRRFEQSSSRLVPVPPVKELLESLQSFQYHPQPLLVEPLETAVGLLGRPEMWTPPFATWISSQLQPL